jgi:O-acetyl-ADP-ribose deacetylase (regulator of RNase III)
MIDITYHQNTQGRPFRLVQGDLIQMASERHFDVIGHGCNCIHNMGAGIAKTLAQRFPQVFEADLLTPKDDPAKLGTYSKAQVVELDLTILNIYSQHLYRGPLPLANYPAIERAARSIAAEFPGKRLGLPLIGAGLAGGDWLIIKEILGSELEALDLTVVVYAPPSPSNKHHET